MKNENKVTIKNRKIMIHKFSRYLLTLVALLAMTTGAWADEGELLVTITPDASGNIVYSVADIATLDLGGAEYNSSKGCWRKFGGAAYLTVTAADGINVTKVKFTTNKNDSWEDTDAPYQVQLDGGYALNASGSSIGTGDGIKKIEVFGTKAAGPVVEISTDQQSAEFDMPSYDATLEYDIVRNLASKVDVQVQLNNVETTKLRIIKDGEGKYHPENGWSFIAYDMIDANNPVSLNGQVVYTLKKKNDQGEYTAVNFETDLCPGTWRLEVEGMETGNYGGIAYGEDITLYEGYEVTVPAGEYITYYKDEPVRVDHTEQPFAEIYTISEVGETTATLSGPLDAMKANKPMLVYNNSTETQKILLIPCNEPDVLLSVAKEFVGTTTATSIPASTSSESNYAFNGKDFVWVKNEIAIGANKCWISITKASSVRSITLVNNSPTAIGATLVNSEEVNSEEWFDLNGRKVNKPTKKGIYIKNGQKVVIK